MQRLVSYDSSSSDDSGESAAPQKKLKHTVAPHEESEVSSSVVQDESNGLTAESTQDRATALLDLGCSREQVAHAIDIWGQATPVEDLYDFIQAKECVVQEGNLLSVNVKDLGLNGGENANTLQELESIGFSPDLVHKASEECNSIDFDVLLEHLVKTAKENGHSQNQSQSEVKSLGTNSQTENRSATPLERLLMMGYTRMDIQRASDECISIDFDVLLAHLIEAEEEDSHNQASSAADSFEDDGGEVTPVKELQNIEFTDFPIKRAMETSGCEDFEGFFNDFSASEYMNNKGDMDKGREGRQFPVNISSSQERFTCASLSKRKHSAGENVSSSICQWGEVKWTGNMEKQWYSYVGGKKKSDPLLLVSESEDSESDMSGSAWKDETSKPRRGRKKLEFSPHKQAIKVTPMQGKKMGFGIPSCFIGRPNPISYHMQGPPYFYYENVASVPNHEWDTIKRHFNGVDPEFTDSKFFSAARRPRGYVHNLPIEDRKQLLCMPPMTIFEALPDTQKYWPSWDTREKLNCINTRKAPDSLCGLIRTLFRVHEGVDIPYSRQQEIVQVCKKWNLVWVGPGQTAPLEPFEIELLLGFDRDHTRGCSSMTERYDALGNSFQVNTVAYHLSPLKVLYPDGITVLSLFSGIGGAEVALDKLGVHLKLVIAVEINEKLRGVLASWWKKSGQTGELKLREDVRDLTNDVLGDLIDEVGRIDLVIGGSPCNNLSGNNRVSRVGLCGIDSSLFFEFTRILTFVRQAMHERGFV